MKCIYKLQKSYPQFAMTGEFCPIGKAPVNDSDENSFPNPDKYCMVESIKQFDTGMILIIEKLINNYF